MLPDPTACNVVELRRYTLRAGRRDELIELFDREFVESQEDHGMSVLGQFRDLEEPDRFVWLRGFTDMTTRHAGLTGFYGGPVWAAHRDAANATMIDSDDVLLLRPCHSLPAAAGPRPGAGAHDDAASLVVMTICPLSGESDDEFADYFDHYVASALSDAGGAPAATLRTEHAPNTFPALPVREGEHVFVWISVFADGAAHDDYRRRLAASEAWTKAWPSLRERMSGPMEEMRLRPTARSLLR